MTGAVQELRCTLASGLRLAARLHNQGAPQRVLAVHGWLDNAASFDALASHLPEVELLAVELAGHGRSGHRPAGAWYHYVDYLDELLEVLDQLGWQQSHWLGHSLGGALLSLLAAARPERVGRLVLLESGGPLGGHAGDAVTQLRRGLEDRARYRPGRRPRVFADIGQAVAARRQANPGLSEPAASALVERGVAAVEGGWTWASDPRLTLASPFRVDEAQVRALLAAIACPTLVVLADPPMPYLRPEDRAARMAALAAARIETLPGHHHLHMETPAAVADLLRPFLAGD